MGRSISEFIKKHVTEVRPLHKAMAIASWEASISGKKEDFDRAAELEKKSLDIYTRKSEYEELAAFHADLDSITDPLERRQVQLLYRAYRRNQGDRTLLNRLVDLENELSRAFNTFRSTYKGKKCPNNELETILRKTTNDTEAREVWESLKQIGAMAQSRVVTIVKLRNELARSLGADDYYDFSMEMSEIDQDWLFSLLGELEKQTDPLFRRMRNKLDPDLAQKFSIGKEKLRPWHYRNQFFQEMPTDSTINLDPVFANQDIAELTTKYYDGLGLDIRPILARSDLYEKEGKAQNAFCMGVDNPTDVRILCNITPTAQWMSTTLHEFGHGVYDAGIDPNLPYLLRHPAHLLSTEAIAMLNERFYESADFLNKIAGVERTKAEEFEEELLLHKQNKLLVFARWVMVMTHFERAMYEHPDRDLSGLWWKLVKKYQWLDGSSRAEMPDWAAKTHLALSPVYYHNYLLGEMSASQILQALRREIAPETTIVGNPKIGKFLTEKIFSKGAAKPWNDSLSDATGEKLNTKYYIDDLS